MNTPGRTIVFDFDGTISLGDGPVLRYAHHVAETLPPEARARFDAEVSAGLPGVGRSADALDGYALVQTLAARHDVPAAELSAAFLASRAELGGAVAPVTAPEGLAGFLDDLDGRALRVLATNSPDIRIVEALEALGLAGRFDLVITDAGKPGGMHAVLDRVDPGPEAGSPGERLLSIGDLWVNDLAPAHDRGFSTAFVGAEPPAGARPTFSAPDVSGLYDAIDAWLGDSRSAASTGASRPVSAPSS
ncbi:HAD family hydrolase [Herbiconiux sp. P18]|uniref:HAD family hydrolase n=1 Tax=Herbiconiux liangxiaofengii TaxID=3342795 RepID=UPI0035BB63C8